MIYIIRKILLIITGVLILLLLTLQLPPIQNKLAKKVLHKLNQNRSIPLSIEKIQFTFFTRLKAKNVYLGSSPSDTIVFASELVAGINPIKLLNNNIQLNIIRLEDAYINLVKNPNDSLLNIESVFQNTKERNTTQKNGSPPQISIEKLRLKNIRFTFNNQPDSSLLNIHLNELTIGLNQFDLKNKNIDLRYISINGVFVNMHQNKLIPNETKDTSSPFTIEIENKIKVKNANVRLSNTVENQTISVNKANAEIQTLRISLAENNIFLHSAELSGAVIKIENDRLNRTDSIRVAAFNNQKTENDLQWNIRTDRLDMKNNSYISITNHSHNYLQSDSDTFAISAISTTIDSIHLQKNRFQAIVKTMQCNLNNTLPIENLRVRAYMDNKIASLQQLHIETQNSMAGANVILSYRNPEILKMNRGEINLKLNLHGTASTLDLKEYIPDTFVMKQYPVLDFAANVKGKLSDIQINTLSIKAGNALSMLLHGRVKHLPDLKQAHTHVNINHISLNKKAILNYVTDTILPFNLSFPDSLLLYGDLQGTTANLKSNLTLRSSLGNLWTNLRLNTDSTPGHEYFAAQMQLDSFHLGQILQKPDTLGLVSLTGKITGSTLNFKKPQVKLNFVVRQSQIFQYNYHNIMLDGNYKEDFFNGKVSIHDPNADLNFFGRIDMSDSLNKYNFNLTIGHANLKALHLSADTSYAHGNLRMNITGKNFQTLNGTVTADSLFYFSGQQALQIDSLKANMLQFSDSSKYTFLFYAPTIQDSLLADRAKVQTTIIGESAQFNFNAWKHFPGRDTSNTILSGTGKIRNAGDSLSAKARINIQEDRFMNPLSYRLHLLRINQNSATQKLSFDMKGSGLRVLASGMLTQEKNKKKSKNKIEASVSIDSLNLFLVNPFIGNNFSKFKGHVSGNMDISGDMEHPTLNGLVTFVNTTIRHNAVNTDFTLKNESCKIISNTFQFNDFTVTDKFGNKARVDGRINLDKSKESNIDLTLNANNFQLLDRSAETAELYFGKIVTDLNASVTGSLNSPVITLNTDFSKASDFSFVVPPKQSSAQEQVDVITFIENDTGQLHANSVKSDRDSVGKTKLRNFALTSNISITEKLDITLITDPASDENLNFSGNGNMSFSINKSGNISLTGRYNIERGKYRLRLYDVIKREFEIEQGSSLTWSGNLTEATADISAIYSLSTSTLALIKSRQPRLSAEQIENYRNPIDINVIMQVTGNLLTPNINFDIELDEDNPGSEIKRVISDLNTNESELNKQVFSLLLFNSFSVESLGGSTAISYELQNTAMQSLSELLSQQINRFSRQYIKGVDVSFNIDSYNQFTQNEITTRTDVNVDLSRKLFSDRLTVEIGGSVAVKETGQGSENLVSANDLAGDFNVEYKITEDGTYLLQAFNKTDFEGEIEGEVTKTGLSLIFNKDFSKLKDLFKNTSKKEGE